MQINLERKPDIPYIKESVQQYISEKRDADIFIAPLSLCKNVYGETDFMNEKRNDYYATVLATAFGADELLLSTQINHIYANRNSRREQHSLTYTEAEQLINSGVYLLYADCISLAAHSNITIRLTDTHDLTTERLYISSHDTGNSVKAILFQDSVTFVRFTSLNVLPGYLLMGKLLEVINKYKINVISMASSNVSISMVISASPDTLRIVQKELHKYAEMVIDENMSVIHIIGSLHWQRTQVESHIMNTIKDIPISQISYGGSDQCFTLSVHTTDKNRLISLLAAHFFENEFAT
jgi:aspartate kinase